MSDPNSRRMIYPYTHAAKIANFPYAFYFKNNQFFRYWMYSIVVCIPIFGWIQNKSYSPGNVKAFAEKAEREKAKAAHH